MGKYLFIFFSSLAIYCVSMVLRGGDISIGGLKGFPLSMLVGYILYFAFTLLMLYKFEGRIKRRGILLSSILGCIILELPIRIIYFQSTLISLADTVFKVLAIFIAYEVYNVRGRFYKILIFTIGMSLCIWMTFCGYNIWVHKVNFGTFDGHTKQFFDKPLVFLNEHGENISIDNFGDKYVILNFWTSTCGACLKKFPQVQELHENIQNRTDIVLYSIFCYVPSRNEGIKSGSNILRKNGYTFSNLSIDMNAPALKEIGINGFPTVLILKPSGTIIFRGSLEYAIKFLNRITSS